MTIAVFIGKGRVPCEMQLGTWDGYPDEIVGRAVSRLLG